LNLLFRSLKVATGLNPCRKRKSHRKSSGLALQRHQHN